MGLRDENTDILFIDWGGPAAALCYHANHASALRGVRRRFLHPRHLPTVLAARSAILSQ